MIGKVYDNKKVKVSTVFVVFAQLGCGGGIFLAYKPAFDQIEFNSNHICISISPSSPFLVHF